MPTNRRIFSQDAAATSGDASSAEGLILHLDANDEDSIEAGGANTGNGSGTWFDIANHDLNVPLIDKGTNLVLHLNASDTTSYSGSGGTWTDLSTYGNNGTINNATFASDTRGYFDFERSNADENVEIADSSSLDISTNITLESWINEESVAPFGRLFWKNGAYALYRGTNGWNFLTGSDILVHNSDIPSTGTWYHIAATYDGANKKLYINGTLVDTDSETASIPTNNNSLYIGGDGTTARFFDGKVSAVRIYNVALTASEVAQNFRANSFLSFDSIYSTDLEMNLDAANYTSGSTFTDSSGNGNNGTISSTPSFDKELGNHLNFSQGQTSGASTMSTNRLTVSSFAALRTSTNFSIEIWLKSSTASSDGMIWNVFDGGSGTKWSLSWNTSKFRWAVHNASGIFQGGQDAFTENTFSTNTWLHIVATYNNGTEQKIYVNGIFEGEASSPNAGTNTTTTVQMRWGDRSDGYAVDTQIGQARYYSAALTSAQVAQNYLATKNDYPNGFNGAITSAIFKTNSSSPNENYFEFTGSERVDLSYFTIMEQDTTVTIYGKYDNVGSGSSQQYLFTKYQSAPSGQFGFLVQKQQNKDSLSWTMRDTSNQLVISLVDKGTITAGDWFHLVLVYVKSTSGTMYINGTQVGTTSYATSNPYGTNTDFLRLGNYTAAGLDGQIGQFKVFEKAFTASEVLAEYNATKSTYGL
ncbi:MAG: putative concanavalin A-like lectin/glucanases superfamily protein [Prokaryotic dsDNA virus sp.]|nr:MAG: putative concanavalin A-like lectin/glucanases superfamily protein [Prokaryotic dsDNA virus sp.]|tara:strand:+ start:40 stop:2139 length:2100 start_codon:yes stop_codon:yes gene_type:complete